MRFRSWFAPAAACGLAMALIAPAAAIVKVGSSAPAWSGKTTTGKALGSAQLKGKVVLLNFFNNY